MSEKVIQPQDISDFMKGRYKSYKNFLTRYLDSISLRIHLLSHQHQPWRNIWLLAERQWRMTLSTLL
ncbi:uncharacterized [Tachysurus ichikawai]